MYKPKLADYIKERCRVCDAPAIIVENDTNFYCADCIVKRDKEEVKRNEPNNSRFRDVLR